MKWLYFLLLLITIPLLTGCQPDRKPKEYVVSFSIANENYESLQYAEGTLLTLSMLPLVVSSDDDLVFGGWFFDEQFTDPFFDWKVVSNLTLYGKYEQKPIKAEVLALDSLSLPKTVSESISLPTEIGGFLVQWETSDEAYLTAEGKYVNTTKADVSVLMRALITTTETFQKEFTVLVKGYPFDEVFSQALTEFEIPTITNQNLILPVHFANAVVGSWESNKPDIISTSGEVNLSKAQEEVLLTLRLVKYDEVYEQTFRVVTAIRPYTVNDYEYFVNQLKLDVQALIMDEAEINFFNHQVLSTQATKTVNLETIAETQSKTSIYNLITSYNHFTKYPIYQPSGALATDSEKNSILENRNLNGLADEIAIQYAVSTTHVNLRSYPTDFYSSNYSTDRFQETGFGLGIPMVIYHTSLDGQWFFVQMLNYYGWVRAKQVAFCTREQFLSYVNPEQFVVVIDSDFVLGEEYLRMGTRLPYFSKTDKDYLLAFPVRSCLGFLQIVDFSFTNQGELSDGYLPYNYENLLSQAFKMLGVSYSWGDKQVKGFDCSSTQAAIYQCFGFFLGRNTSNQRVTKQYGGTLSNLSNESLKDMKVGTLLYTSGHVLMFIGVDEAGQCWLLHNTSLGNKTILQTLNDYGTTNIKYYLSFHN